MAFTAFTFHQPILYSCNYCDGDITISPGDLHVGICDTCLVMETHFYTAFGVAFALYDAYFSSEEVDFGA